MSSQTRNKDTKRQKRSKRAGTSADATAGGSSRAGAGKRERTSGASRLDRLLGAATTPRSILAPRLVVIGCVAALLAIGLVMVYSASSIEAYANYGEASYFLKRQALMVVIGIVIVAGIVALPFSIWNSHNLWVIWMVAVGLLVLVEAAGFVGLGAKRWVTLGPISFQPSEFAKIATMLMCAYLLVAYREGKFATFGQFLARFVLIVVLPAGFILIQPDLGTTLVMLVSVVAAMWFGEVNRKIVVGLVLGVVVIAVVFSIARGFRSERILAWLDPWSDPYDTGYQIINSFYAFSNGGLFGVGLGNSTQKYLYLPYAYNDFIFAVVGEELGFVGALGVIALFFALAFFSFRIGAAADSLFGKIVADASATTIVFQAFLNMACVMGVLPVTGKPLPFISYGGSSMIATMILVGLILAVSFKNSTDAATRKRESIRVYKGRSDRRRRAS